MVKKGYYGNEGFGLAWDLIKVSYVALIITTKYVIKPCKWKQKNVTIK